MADLQTDGARVLSLWRNEGISNYRKDPRNPGRLAEFHDRYRQRRGHRGPYVGQAFTANSP
jgi:hypothetical protein